MTEAVGAVGAVVAVTAVVNRMDEIDQQLRQLVIAACGQPRGSLKRQRALNQLIWQIQRSGKLLRGVGVPDYEDALQQTWLYCCRNLCEALTGNAYDPELASVITWLNAYLKRRLSDRQREVFQQQAERAFGQLAETGEVINPIDTLPTPANPPPILEEIREWVERESRQLRRIHVRDRPDINCEVLILRRLPPETAWEALSQEFGVAIATLSNFYQRECFPRLLKFGQTQGYLDS